MSLTSTSPKSVVSPSFTVISSIVIPSLLSSLINVTDAFDEGGTFLMMKYPSFTSISSFLILRLLSITNLILSGVAINLPSWRIVFPCFLIDELLTVFFTNLTFIIPVLVVFLSLTSTGT